MGNTCRGKLLKANDRTASTSNADKPSRKEGLAHSVHDDPDLTVKGETGEAVMLEETMGHRAVKRKTRQQICVSKTNSLVSLGPVEIIEITSKTSCDSAVGHSLLNRNKADSTSESRSRSVSASFPNMKWGYFDKLEAEEALLSIWKTSCKQCQWKDEFFKVSQICNYNTYWVPAYDLISDLQVPKYLQEPVALFHLTGGAARLNTESIRRSVFPKIIEAFELLMSVSETHLHNCFLRINEILSHEDIHKMSDSIGESTLEGSDENIPSFCVRLYRNHIPEYFIVDCDVPVFGPEDEKQNGGCLENEYWPLILEKAIAKQYGGYENIGALNSGQIFHSLVGGNCHHLQLEDALGTRDSENDNMTVETFWHLLLNLYADGDIICVKCEECELTNKPNEYLQCTEFVRNKTCRDDGNESIVEESVSEDSEGFTKEKIECMTGRFVQINHEKYYSWEKTLSKKKFFVCLLPHDDKPFRELNFFPNTKVTQGDTHKNSYEI